MDSDTTVRKENGLLSQSTYCPKLKVLMVEDNPTIQCINCVQLELLHCDCDLAVNGEEALSKFNQYQYDIILLDIDLPDINGLDICRIMRQQETEKRTPIIFITTYHEKLYQQAIEAGGDQCFSKPLSLKHLSHIINQIIS